MSPAPEKEYIKINKIFASALCGVCMTALGSAAKAYIDVEKMKTSMDHYVDGQKELKEDIKEIKQDIKTLLSKGG